MRHPRVRFAFRLALHLGIADPLDWLDTVDPVVVECFAISLEQHALPDNALNTAMVCNEVYQLAALIGATNGVKLPERSLNAWLPDIKRPDTAADLTTMSVNDELAWAARRVTKGK